MCNHNEDLYATRKRSGDYVTALTSKSGGHFCQFTGAMEHRMKLILL
jgi:hypothetical protein